jgi:predicted AlkP superfamily pyrophosphatase or phosphodiesterase
MKHLLILMLPVVAMVSCKQQPLSAQQPSGPNRPVLIVGLTVDQMRYDYIYKYWDDFGDGGFKRLVNEGAFFENAHFNYSPTLTACGHASIFTGTTPAVSGIAGNDWWERGERKRVYCASDAEVQGVGTESSAGKMSPHRLLAATMGDALKVWTNGQSKVIGISLKDRGAILPAGRSADAAYWFVSGSEGKWVTSSWYMDKLPGWVETFNARGLSEKYIKAGWDLFLPEAAYAKSAPDNNPYEVPFKGTTKPVFPYDLEALRSENGNYELIRETPAGTTLTFEFAKECIRQEGLGKDAVIDLLSVSFSSPDYVGHRFGPHSREMQDTYARLDRELADFLSFLDKEAGKGKYLLFLTSDHGGADVPSLTKDMKMATGYFKMSQLKPKVEEFLKNRYGVDSLLVHAEKEGFQWYLNRPLIRELKLSQEQIENELCLFLVEQPGVLKAYPGHALRSGLVNDHLGQLYQRGTHHFRSGDVLMTLIPGWLDYGLQGTHHGAPHAYDTHVPVIFFGAGIPAMKSNTRIAIEDIAPTVSYLTKTPLPNGATGQPIPDLK